MALSFLRESPSTALSRLQRDLRVLNPKLNLRRFFNETPSRLDSLIEQIDARRASVFRSARYGSWLTDPGYQQDGMLKEALELIKQMRVAKEAREVLVPDYTYYRGVKQFGPILEGQRCHMVNQTEPNWIAFRTPIAVMKAIEVIRHGDLEDFRTIYMEHANGRIDGLQRVSIQHISESTQDALKQIESYCDTRWDGAWPWENRAPMKLHTRIEEARNMRKMSVKEMRGRFDHILRVLREGEMEKFEVMTTLNTMIDQLDGMISDLGKLSSAAIESAAAARALVGDEVASSIESSVTPGISQMSQSLSQMKASLEQARDHIQSGTGGGEMNEPGLGGDAGGDLGTPADALGTPPEDNLEHDIADVDLDGSDEERLKKPM